HCGWNTGQHDATGQQPYFPPCPGSPKPSMCIPYAESAFDSSPGAYFASVGFCIPNGNAPANADCNPNGSTTDLSQDCPAKQICVPVGEDGGTCLTACNYGANPTIGATCPSSSAQCANASGVSFQQSPEVQLGACLKVCNLFGTQPECAANPSGRAFTCQIDPSETDLSTGLGLCLPTIPNA